MSNLPYKQAANVERRTWDKELYEARAKARVAPSKKKNALPINPSEPTSCSRKRALDSDDEEKEEFQPAMTGMAGPESSQRAFLKSRRKKVDLESKIGSSDIINPDAVAISGGATKGISISDGVEKTTSGVGWYCRVCDCYLKDSIGYLDHINGRKHQRYLGYSMRVEKSSADQVLSKLSELSKIKQERQQTCVQANQNVEKDENDLDEFEDVVRRKDEEARRRKVERERRKEEIRKKKIEEEEEAEVHPDLAKMMGFSGFGSVN